MAAETTRRRPAAVAEKGHALARFLLDRGARNARLSAADPGVGAP
ncbi:MAG: hypothetical protein OXG13_18290 [Gemmatimonadaceae bacterium]|nr:hypothetical protein [Gemmatimonadaceae bacterium]